MVLCFQLDFKDNWMKELEVELVMVKQFLVMLIKDVFKWYFFVMLGEMVFNGNQEWVVQVDFLLIVVIWQS